MMMLSSILKSVLKSQDSAKAYLKKAHAKFIPNTAQMRDGDTVDKE